MRFPSATRLVILIDAYPQHDWLVGALAKRLREELARLRVVLNEAKSRVVNVAKGDAFGFLGFDFRTSAHAFGQMAGALRSVPEEVHGALAAVEGVLPTVSIAACRSGDRVDQSDPSRLGDLLCHRPLDSLFRLCAGLGGEESEASLDAGTETERVRLEEVE